MTPQEFGKLKTFLKERSGLNLTEEKRSMVEGRLRPVMQQFGIPNFTGLLEAISGPGSEELRQTVAQAVSIQESYFFRDKTPFEYFADTILPNLMQARAANRRIRIWSAAAATGQEAYSLAMQLKELGDKLKGWTINIVATDFCEEALRKARIGIYTQFEVQRGLPVSMMVKYFKRLGGPWQISEELRGMVQFRSHNLLEDSRSLGIFDVVLCRNVLIYFDDDTKRDVLKRLSGQLATDGYLILGSAETVVGLNDQLVNADPGLHGIYCLATRQAMSAVKTWSAVFATP